MDIHDLLTKELKSYRVLHQVDEDGGPSPLSDALTPSWEKTIELGLEEIEHLVYCLSHAINEHFEISEKKTSSTLAQDYK